jgi:hypothetical protein
MFVTPSIWCHSQHFFKVTVFFQYFGSIFLIYLTILCMPIPIIFFLGFLTWAFHSHFVEVKYMTRGPIGRSVVYSNSPLRFFPYNNNSPYLCFPFEKWYEYSRFRIRCGFYFFMIVARLFNIRVFSIVGEVCSLVSIKVGPFYFISSWLFYSEFRFSYFGHTNGI